MTPADIVILVVVIAVVGAVVGTYIYKRIKGLPTGECSCCSNNMKKSVKRAMKNIKLDELEDDEHECSCGCGSNCHNNDQLVK